MKKTIIIILIFIMLSFIAYYTYENFGLSRDTNNNIQPTDQTPEPKDVELRSDYTNSKYDFSLKYPASWKSFIAADSIAPKYNFYLEGYFVNTEMLPFDHFVNETHVSVYPLGIPSENLFAPSIPVSESQINFPYEVTANSRIFTLSNGEPFAAYLIPVDQPDSWNGSGFVWVRVKVDNLSTRCLRDGEVIEQDQCDMMVMQDEIVWNGEVDSAKWNEAIKTAESFSFVKVDSGNNNGSGDDDDSGDGTGSAQNESLIVTNPKPEQVISSPLELKGQVRGSWLFEATAPVVLTDWDGRIIAEGYIEAEEDWMTTNFVPFTGTLEFEIPEDIGDFSDRGSLIFQKSNASGLPEHDDALEFTINFR